MGRLAEIEAAEAPELLALFRAATKDAIYARVDAEYTKLPAERNQATAQWLSRAMDQRRWASLGTALMQFCLCRDATLLATRRPQTELERQALEDRVATLVATHLPKFIELNL